MPAWSFLDQNTDHGWGSSNFHLRPATCRFRPIPGRPHPPFTLSVPPTAAENDPQTARVIVTNDGAIPTRFTVANGITNPAAGGNASVGIPAPTTSPVVRTTTDATAITGAHNTTQPGEEVIEATPSPNNEDGARMLLDNRDREGDTQSDARESARGPPTEDQLLQKACAFGDAGTQQSEGKRELEVAGGGEIAGYSSSEIVVTFSPLSVGAFRTAKVRGGGLRGAGGT